MTILHTISFFGVRPTGAGTGAAMLLAIGMSLGAPASAVSDPVAQALSAIETSAKASNSDATLVMHNGELLLEQYSRDGNQPMELMSVTKSVVALGVGALLQDGLLDSLDTPVHSFYPEWKQGRKEAITVRMLLDHTSGLQNEGRPAVEIYPAPDVVKLALAAELSDDPGTYPAYNNKAVNLLAGIFMQAAGEPMDRYIERRLFTPMGLRSGEWFRDKAGNPHAMAGAHLDARGLAAVGQLVLDRGAFNGQQLVPADFIDEMLSASTLSRELGLLWFRRVAWVRLHADAESFARIESAGVSEAFLEALRPLDGQQFNDPEALTEALAGTLGPNWFDRWHEELIAPHGIGPWAPFHPELGPVEVFEANGSLGQYIVVIPKARLVAVRQILSREGHQPTDDYSAFTQHVQMLADALVDKP